MFFTLEERDALEDIMRRAKGSGKIRRADLQQLKAAERVIDRDTQKSIYLCKGYEAKIERVEPGGAEFEECILQMEQLNEECVRAQIFAISLREVTLYTNPCGYHPRIEIID